MKFRYILLERPVERKGRTQCGGPGRPGASWRSPIPRPSVVLVAALAMGPLCGAVTSSRAAQPEDPDEIEQQLNVTPEAKQAALDAARERIGEISSLETITKPELREFPFGAALADLLSRHRTPPTPAEGAVVTAEMAEEAAYHADKASEFAAEVTDILGTAPRTEEELREMRSSGLEHNCRDGDTFAQVEDCASYTFSDPEDTGDFKIREDLVSYMAGLAHEARFRASVLVTQAARATANAAIGAKEAYYLAIGGRSAAWDAARARFPEKTFRAVVARRVARLAERGPLVAFLAFASAMNAGRSFEESMEILDRTEAREGRVARAAYAAGMFLDLAEALDDVGAWPLAIGAALSAETHDREVEGWDREIHAAFIEQTKAGTDADEETYKTVLWFNLLCRAYEERARQYATLARRFAALAAETARERG